MSTLVRSAKVVILDAAGRALLLRRSETHPEFPFVPDLPGGTILEGETYENGMVRELYEETGISTGQIKSIHRLYKGVFYEPNKESERILFGVRLLEEKPKVTLSSEHDRYDWVSVDDLKGIEEPYQGGIRYAHLYDLWKTII